MTNSLAVRVSQDTAGDPMLGWSICRRQGGTASRLGSAALRARSSAHSRRQDDRGDGRQIVRWGIVEHPVLGEITLDGRAGDETAAWTACDHRACSQQALGWIRHLGTCACADQPPSPRTRVVWQAGDGQVAFIQTAFSKSVLPELVAGAKAPLGTTLLRVGLYFVARSTLSASML